MAISNTHRYSVVRKFLFCFTLLFLLGSQIAYSEEASDASAVSDDVVDNKKAKPSVSDEDIKKEIGVNRPKALALEQHPDIELTMKTSVEKLTAGEPWTIFATMSNHSKFPIWIVDATTTLLVPFEVSRDNVGSKGAFFPTISPRGENEIIRIEPNSGYTFRYKNDDSSNGILGHIFSVVEKYAFFIPGIYDIHSVIHVWVAPPEIEQGKVKNYGDTITINSSISKAIESSPWVLIVGASIGGILCFKLERYFQNESIQKTETQRENPIEISDRITTNSSNPIMERLKKFPILYFIVQEIFSWLPSILLTSSVTILLSRLSTTDFLVAVKINDIWGAVVVGFIIQWKGYPFLSRIMNQAIVEKDN